MTGAAEPGTPFDVSELQPGDTRDVSPAQYFFLSFLTLGIWGVAAFHRTATRYQRLSARRFVAFKICFWVWVAGLVASSWLWPMALVGIGAGAVALLEAMALRVRAAWPA